MEGVIYIHSHVYNTADTHTSNDRNFVLPSIPSVFGSYCNENLEVHEQTKEWIDLDDVVGFLNFLTFFFPFFFSVRVRFGRLVSTIHSEGVPNVGTRLSWG